MLAVVEHPESDEVVAVVDNILIVQQLTESAPEVVRLVSVSDDPAGLVHECLRAGARSLAVVRSGLDMAALDRTVAQVESNVRAAHEGFGREIARTASELLGEGDSALPATLAAWRREVAATLDAAMDPKRRDSLLARVDASVGRLLENQRATFERLLDPEAADGVIGRILSTTDPRLIPLAEEVRRLREVVVANHASSLALERSAVKGLVFEDFVSQAVIDIASSVGDVGEAVGRTTGRSGGRVGDIQVTCGSARYVVEVKDRRVSLPAALAEARTAMANREAAAALIVFSGEHTCPVTSSFAVFDDVAVVHRQGGAGSARPRCWMQLGSRPGRTRRPANRRCRRRRGRRSREAGRGLPRGSNGDPALPWRHPKGSGSSGRRPPGPHDRRPRSDRATPSRGRCRGRGVTQLPLRTDGVR